MCTWYMYCDVHIVPLVEGGYGAALDWMYRWIHPHHHGDGEHTQRGVRMDADTYLDLKGEIEAMRREIARKKLLLLECWIGAHEGIKEMYTREEE